MNNFVYECPTKIIFGKDKELEVGKIIKNYGSKVLIHYGGGSVIKSGLLDRVKKALDEEGINYLELGGVKPNPRLSLVKKGIELVRKEGIDFILAVGGGSVIDSSKAIGLGAVHDFDLWEIYLRKKEPQGHIPVGVILTIPAAGSEMSTSAVITNEETNEKRGYNTVFNRPAFSILNPELIYTVPKYHLSAGVCDMFVHIIERYFTNTKNVRVTDNLCLGLMKTIVEVGPKFINDITNYDYAAEIMWASSIAHNGLLDTGRVSDWASHNIEHALSAHYDISHGGGLAVIVPNWMKYVYKHNLDIFVTYAHEVFNVEKVGTKEEIALKGIQKTSEFFASLGLPLTLKDYNIDDSKFSQMAAAAAYFGPLGNFVPLSKEDIINIYRSAL